MASAFTDKLQSIKINSHVSPYLTFYDPKISHEYQMFKVAQSNPYSFLPLHLCNVFFFLFGAYSALSLNYDRFNVFNACVCSFFNLILGNWILIVHFKDSLFPKDSFIYKYITPTYISFLESFWIIGCAIDLSLVCVTIVHNGLCPASFEHVQIARGCNYSGDIHEIPMDLICALFFAPMICMVVLKGGSFVSVIIAVAINSITLFSTMYLGNMHFEGPIILLFCPMCVLVLYEFQRQGISVFLLSQSQQILLEEIDRLSNQTAKELRSMIGNVAHDLKTPMSAFMSGMDMISCELMTMQSKAANQEDIDKMQFIADNVTHMMNINSFMRMSINRCIDYTKASNGMVLVPHMETVNFREMLNLPLSCMKNLQNSKILLEMKPIPDEITTYVITDPQWFQENVLCLLSNAVKYSAEGLVSIGVSLLPCSPPNSPSSAALAALVADSNSGASSAASSIAALESKPESGMMIRIDIIDSGIGISDELKPRLFNPFKQAQRMAGGTGLGLYSLAKRMEAIGGKYGIRNRSDGEQGCNFWFSIPYRPDESHDLNKQEECATPTTGSGGDPVINRRILNILLVDDSISILKMTGKMLTRLGHTVTNAENGAEALKMVRSTFVHNNTSPKAGSVDLPLEPRYDVVLMDLQMPIMDGLEATSRVRALEKELESDGGGSVHQIIIGMSANSDHETAVASFEAGVDDFIPKPFNSKTFEMVYQKIYNKRCILEGAHSTTTSTCTSEVNTPVALPSSHHKEKKVVGWSSDQDGTALSPLDVSTLSHT